MVLPVIGLTQEPTLPSYKCAISDLQWSNAISSYLR